MGIQTQNKHQADMFTRAALSAALLATAAQAFTAPSALPMRSARASAAISGLRAQANEKAESESVGDSIKLATEEFEAKSVSTGGTDYVSVPKKEITPLFLIPSSSVVGKGDMVGDKGFDPLGLATSAEKLKTFREAEIKHGRLAMLAALGWPLSEEVNGPLAKALGMQSLLVTGCDAASTSAQCTEVLSRAPSVLNGGLQNVSPLYWAGVIAFSGAVEAYGQKIAKRPNYLPGDLGFDPLGLYQGKDAAGKLDIQLKELNNGRLAMIAITGYAFNEAATKISVAAPFQ